MNLSLRKIGIERWRLSAGTVATVVMLVCLESSQAQAPVPPETTNWVASLSAGFTLTGGNTETLQASLGFDAVRLWPRDEFRANLSVLYGENDLHQKSGGQNVSNVSTEKGIAMAQYNHLFTDRWYGSVRADYLHDGISDVFYRFIIGPAAGYYVIKNDYTRFNLEVAPSLIYEKTREKDSIVSVGPPKVIHFEHPTHGYYLLRLTERLEQKLSPSAKFWEQLDYLPPIDDFTGNYLLNGQIGLEVAINTRLALRTVGYWNYDNQPSPHNEANDLAWITSLVYKF